MLSVSQALLRRRTIRKFLPNKTVPRSVLEDILKTAARAPSGGNLQPWKVYVLMGSKKAELIKAIQEQLPSKPKGETPSPYNTFPPELKEIYMDRRRDVASRMYGALNIGRKDKDKRVAHWNANWRFFDAPVGMIFTMDKQMEHPQYGDLGIFMQSLMLLAEEKGLGTCPQAAWAEWAKTTAKVLNIADNEQVLAGMAFGYTDESDPVNHLNTERMELSEFVEFMDEPEEL